ncbi:MAG: VWA domain-containing protein [Acidobacteria bacterium]|nr:VWA domain-containing protein [Acidobacteriota bacterium]
MKKMLSRRLFAVAVAMTFLLLPFSGPGARAGLAQSRRQPPTAPQKKNPRPDETNPQQPQEPVPTDIIQETETVKVVSALVNVEAVVINKKSKQLVTNLKKENFAIFEDGIRQDISNFSTPEAPITVAMVLEYSKLSQALGYYGSGGMEPGQYEVLRPMAMFLQQFIKPPDDYVSVIAYDMRPTPLTDFTNDPARISQVISLMLRNQPAFNEANLFDALQFVLLGGRGDAVVLENSKSEKADYVGMASLQGRRKAIFLVSTGLDTFSKINYDKARKITQNAGVPIYIIGTGNLFLKKYDQNLNATDGLGGSNQPGRMSFLQADNTLKTFAKETGGMYFPITFPGELPSALSTINAVMRNQYSLGYNPGERRDGKQHKIVVKVDVDGDGQFDEKDYTINSRQFYNAPKG